MRMKTLYKTYTAKKAKTKRLELERSTGLKWDWYVIGIGFCFTAIITKDTETIDLEEAKTLLPFIKKGLFCSNFVSLSDASGKELSWVLKAVKTLVKNQLAVADVNRMGNFAAVHKSI
jgi:hypothetical protein